MRKVKAHAIMCENETGGFVTGIGTETKLYTEKEFKQKKHHELTKGIKLIKGCYWCFSFDWYEQINISPI